jgi:hypothetical protein
MKTAWFIRKFSLTRDKSPGVKNDLWMPILGSDQ